MSILEETKSQHDLIQNAKLKLNQKIEIFGINKKIREILNVNHQKYKFDFRVLPNYGNELIILLLIIQFSKDEKNLLMLSAKHLNLSKKRIIQKGDMIQKLSGKTRKLILNYILNNAEIMELAHYTIFLYKKLREYEKEVLKEVQELFKNSVMREKFYDLNSSDNLMSFRTKDNSEILSLIIYELSNEGGYNIEILNHSNFGLTQDELSKLKELLIKN